MFAGRRRLRTIGGKAVATACPLSLKCPGRFACGACGGPFRRQIQICTIELILKLEPGGFSPMRMTVALVK